MRGRGTQHARRTWQMMGAMSRVKGKANLSDTCAGRGVGGWWTARHKNMKPTITATHDSPTQTPPTPTPKE
jgi:hypothetical protein